MKAFFSQIYPTHHLLGIVYQNWGTPRAYTLGLSTSGAEVLSIVTS